MGVFILAMDKTKMEIIGWPLDVNNEVVTTKGG